MHKWAKAAAPAPAATLAAAALLAAVITARPARADVSLPSVFGSHMVLQRDMADKVWGKADPGEAVTVKLAGQEKAATADDAGKWSVNLDPMPAGGPHVMTVAGKNTLTYEDVLVGEVWLCSGQSNMQWGLGSANDADLESLAAKDAGVRFLSVPNKGTQEPQNDFKGRWEVCTPESARQFSAVGYFFGRQIRQTLGVPVGLIDDSWGGSSCEAWVRRDLLAADPKYKDLMARWEEAEKDLPAKVEAYRRKLDDHKAAVESAKAEGKPAPQPPQNPEARMTGNARPGNIYNGALKPTIGYGLRGAIWYQGESNAGRAYQYRDLFPLMIQSWRDEWGVGDFSFYWAQLADYQAEKPEPGGSQWAELREAQTMTMNRLPKTGQAVIIDLGEAQDIHPRNKQGVAMRLARWALAHDYGLPINCRSPEYQSMEVKGDAVVLSFSNVGSGLKAFDVAEPRGFAVAGADRKFHWAKAKVVGKGKIEVTAEGVSDPVAVRYAWADNPVCNLYSREGLPLTPFRTDDWPGMTAENH